MIPVDFEDIAAIDLLAQFSRQLEERHLRCEAEGPESRDKKGDPSS